jgi:hypothetical protein
MKHRNAEATFLGGSTFVDVRSPYRVRLPVRHVPQFLDQRQPLLE